MKKIKIIVNAIPLTKVLTGIGRVIQSLYSELEKNENIEVWYFNGSSITKKMPSPQNNNFSKLIPIIWKLPWYFSYNIRCIMHNLQQKKFFEISKNFDIYHELGYFPFKTDKKIKTIFTVHDMSLISNPEWHPNERVKFFKKYWKTHFKYADTFVTPSKFSENELKKYYPIKDDNKIAVVPWGCNKNIFFKKSKQEIEKIKKKYKITGDYFLYVGTIEPRKNLFSLLNTFNKLKEEKLKLVITGWVGWEKKKLSFSKNIIFTGRVSDEELASLYSGAISLILLSSYEGFGLPLIEAVNCGTCVICSNIPTFRELFSEKSAIFVDPFSEKEIIKAIKKITDKNYKKQLWRNAIKEIEKYSWIKCADNYFKLFQKVLNTKI